MTTSQILFITLLVLSTSLTTPLTISDHHDHQDHLHGHQDHPVVHITNALPKNNASPMSIRCSSKKTDFGDKTLGCGQVYNWIAQERDVYFCAALWGRYLASWHAFQPKRDADRRSVFWLVNHNGFFLSWDNSTWVRKTVWETE